MTITRIVAEIKKRLDVLDTQYEKVSFDMTRFNYLGDDEKWEEANEKRIQISIEKSALQNMLRAYKNQ